MTSTAPAPRLVIWGASGHAKVIREALGPRSINVCAVFDEIEVDPPFSDVPLHIGESGFRAWIAATASPETVEFIVAIGGAKGEDRLTVHRRLIGFGLRPATVVHDRAFVAATATCATGSQVLAMAAVCADAEVGVQSIINTGATLDHECRVGDGVHIGPGAHVAGLVRIDDLAFIGAGAVLLPRVRIGERAIIGAGTVVLQDVRPGTTVVGNPARELRDPH